MVKYISPLLLAFWELLSLSDEQLDINKIEVRIKDFSNKFFMF